MTITDSKRAFHKAFPYVIPSIYRRVTDELLVEIHLLSNQKNFIPDVLFATGLSNVFDRFTSGYRPAEHLDKLFNSLCKCNGLDPAMLRKSSEEFLDLARSHNQEEVRNWLISKGEGAPEKIYQQLSPARKQEIKYSRLTAVGILNILEVAKKDLSSKEIDNIKSAEEACQKLGFSKERVVKDLNLYKANLEKLKQALDLIQETIKSDRKKRERSSSGDSECKDEILAADST